VSHQPERSEKNCLNCGTIVAGRFCQACGQENVVPKQSAGAFVQHFIFDLFHFDGKFFETLRQLLFKPGAVPLEFVSGRRVQFLDPVRMYLFTSAVFFLIFFSISKIDLDGVDFGGVLSKAERAELAMDLNAQKRLGNVDSFQLTVLDLLLDSTQQISLTKPKTGNEDSVIYYKKNFYSVVAEPDSDSIKSNIDSAENGWVGRKILERKNEFNRKYADDPGEGIRKILESFVHRLPYVMFVSLPFFAFILKLLYLRRRQFFYSEHLVFTLYHYIFSFILLLLILWVIRLEQWSSWSVFDWLLFILFVYGGVYLYKGMRRFYGQSRAKTLWKFFLLNLLGFISLVILLLIFFVFTAFQL